ncbi:RagB/SusD family nutrient uptake outer membrane protein [Adhaeribacter rhizoryzae]|uniref:RagB/SusD family nutrient uptake outer membrane protein n=1 Tax=Adhaeribacter rhizoryzae TaxID=2607907 RepID=A0A5M6D920_9BACT|nr:RagB/SusD family nutrient uptake outer membrane protein [Adhaeribacter rhizoryzae]KAA5542970.1 RagB/SusD family nutrient uptake outer membrane protein [Adhaeribacter rhizoryzae]
MKYILKIYFLASVFAAFSCQDDFLDREPLDVLSTAGSLATTNELRLYVNQFYESFPGHPTITGNTGIAFSDATSDNMIITAVDTRLNGNLSQGNAARLTEYNNIRSVNYFLANYKNAGGDQALINQYLGEAKFFRAWFYFSLIKKYGDVTWVNTVLPADQEMTQLARDSRVVVVDSILADLDKAIALIPAVSTNAGMRVHKDVALAFKSRVALFEGTWQKYHKQDADPFWTKDISDDKIANYLAQAKQAAETIITSGRWSIYTTGKPLEDYGNLYTTLNLAGNKEVMLWRKYDANENIGHSISKYLSTGGGDIGVTLSLVDDYLTRTGTPFVGAARTEAQAVYGRELSPDLRDPRLSQTVAVPGKPLKPSAVVPAFPPINQSGFNRSTTGYPLYKYIEYNSASATFDDNKSSVPAILFRYAEVLLNYAEAMAELGESPALVAQALQPLRARVGMPDVDFDREYNNDPDYSFRNLDKVIQSVRRERRVELAAEGMRLDDIFRWSAADVLIAGKRPLGVLFVGSNIAQENTATGLYKDALLYYDNAPSGKSVNFYLTGNAQASLRYVDPYQRVLPNGFGFNLSRDYLLPIQDRMMQLTNGLWTQNPGW